MYSEVASSYKDEDDALSHYMGQSEYGGLSNIGGLGPGIPTLELGKSNIPSRRMAAKQKDGDAIKNSTQQSNQLNRPASSNYGLFLQQDENKKLPPSQEILKNRQASNNSGSLSGGVGGGGGLGLGAGERSLSPPTRDREGIKDIGFGRP